MRGEFVVVSPKSWSEIWRPLIDDEGSPEEIVCELYRAWNLALKSQSSIEPLADIIDNPMRRRGAFEPTNNNDLTGFRDFVSAMEAAHTDLNDFCGEASRMP